MTLSAGRSIKPISCFNPHTHEGCDYNPQRVVNKYTHVSIHTPTKGVTLNGFIINLIPQSFNPHTHEGCDFGFCLSILWCGKFQSTHPRRVWQLMHNSSAVPLPFQSTHPRRVWPKCSFGLTSETCFNPHTHEGCDTLWFRCSSWWLVSIHTPTKGVTACRSSYARDLQFQSTHPRRVWQ